MTTIDLSHLQNLRPPKQSQTLPEVAITFVTRSCDIVPLCIPEIHEARLKQQHSKTTKGKWFENTSGAFHLWSIHVTLGQ